MAKTNKIGKKAKQEEYLKVLHIMYLYLDEKGLTEDFKRFSAKAQEKGLSKTEYTKYDVFKMNLRAIWARAKGN